MEPLKHRWYVVANRTQSIVYVDGSDRHFHPLFSTDGWAGRLKEGELDSDRPGSGISSAAGSIHHGLDHHFQHHEGEAIHFSRRIAENLSQALKKHEFDELVLVAEPHFLGVLKQSLSPEVQKVVCSEVDKEYVQKPEPELRKLVLEQLKM